MSASKILELAVSQIGTKESPPNSNTVIYNTEYYGRKVSGAGYPWCCSFIWWLFHHLGWDELFYGGNKTAYCPTLMSYHINKGQAVYDNYQPGDIIFFNFSGKRSASHVGICELYNGSTITTIDGNTGNTNEADGGAVLRRTRKKKYIVGAYRPAYPALVEPPKPKNCGVQLPVLSLGMTGDYVKSMQILLTGHACSTAGFTGVFDKKTDTALRKFQRKKKLTIDGKCGPATWKALLGV